MEKAYKFRIYPTKAQAVQMQKTFGSCRFLYNYYLAKQKALYQESKAHLGYVACAKDMTLLKKELTWLAEVDSTALQSALRDLDLAYRHFFRRVKQGQGKSGFPAFKSKREQRKAYTSKMGVKILERHVRLPKLGLVKCKVSKRVEGRILSATVSQAPSGKYFVSVLCTDVEPLLWPSTGHFAGVDVGLKAFAVISDGQILNNPKYLIQSQKKLAKLQRQLSRKQKGSSNRAKARKKVALLHEKVVNQRNDFLHKRSSALVKDYDLLAMEDLKIKNMVRNRRLAKAISDASWGEFQRQIRYKCAWHGKLFVLIDSFFPSSQLCNSCGHKYPAVKDLKVREWTCPVCGSLHNRDQNAAINILNEGLRLVA